MKLVIEALQRQVRLEEAAITANKIEKDQRMNLPGFKGSPLHPERPEYIAELKTAIRILDEAPEVEQGKKIVIDNDKLLIRVKELLQEYSAHLRESDFNKCIEVKTLAELLPVSYKESDALDDQFERAIKEVFGEEKKEVVCTCDESSKQRALCPVCDKEEYEKQRASFPDQLKSTKND